MSRSSLVPESEISDLQILKYFILLVDFSLGEEDDIGGFYLNRGLGDIDGFLP